MWWHIMIWSPAVVLGIVLVLIMMPKRSGSATHTTPPISPTNNRNNNAPCDNNNSGGGFNFKTTFNFLGFVAACFMLFFCCYKIYWWWETPSPRQLATQCTTTHPPIVKIDKQRTLYRFNDNGCTTDIQIHDGEASWYPKGGEVTITPPIPAKPWNDAPGIANDQEGVTHPSGKYQVCKTKDSNAWGIDVWN